MPNLQSGIQFPEWLRERRKQSDRALMPVVADSCVAGVSTWRPDKLLKTLGIHSLSKSQVWRRAADHDDHVDEFLHCFLNEGGPFTLVLADALTMKVSEGGRVIKTVVMIATAVNADGHREENGVATETRETHAGGTCFLLGCPGPLWGETGDR